MVEATEISNNKINNSFALCMHINYDLLCTRRHLNTWIFVDS